MTPTFPPAGGDPVGGDHVVDGHVVDDRLVDLALSEPSTRAESEHLAGCEPCQSSLASLRRTLDVARSSAGVELVPPRPAVWASITAELDADEGVDSTVVPFRQADRGPAGRDGATSRRRFGATWLVAACAAGALVGAGGIVAAQRLGEEQPASPRTLATAELDTLDTEQRLGTATVSEQADAVTLEVSASDLDRSGSAYVEVWLLNRDGKRMVSVGVLRDGASSASFPISQRLLDEGYVVVDLSREQFDDKPQHSGDSIVRGDLTAPA